jgi:RNA-directed DNA polymerase
MNEHGKSDGLVLPVKPSNKAGRPEAEKVEGRGPAEGNPREDSARRTQRRTSASSALERVRHAASEAWRYYPRQEPDAGKPHVRICAGGGS